MHTLTLLLGSLLSLVIALAVIAIAVYIVDPAALLIPIADLVGGWVMFDPSQGWSIQR